MKASVRAACILAITALAAACSSSNDLALCAENNGGCSEFATCSAANGGVSCTCLAGYEGDGWTCSLAGGCSPNPCQNGGTCADAIGGYSCACPEGTEGDHCETNLDDCTPNPCQNDGTCTDAIGGYSCACPEGTEGDHCETNLDDCILAPCLNGGTCIDGIGSYICSCPQGWTGDHCETNLDDCTLNPCLNGGTCIDGVASYICSCAQGWTGARCETNVDDCSPNPCQNGGICTDGVAGHTCACPQGTEGDHCETNLDDCTLNPCQNGGACIDGIGSYTCSCAQGWTGTHCETQVDDCALNPCLNGGACIDRVGGYTCSCAQGWTGTHCAINIDDCAPNPCLNGGTCTDGVASYVCHCAAGWTGDRCQTNIDDCTPNPCLNGGTCVDGIGSYTCSCARGWTGTHCQTNVNDCAPNPCLNGGTCIDGVAGYVCSCPQGWTGKRCQTNIDDCSPNPCQNGGICTDGVAGHTCACPQGTEGDHCETNLDDCTLGVCQNGGTCIDGIGSYSCSCAAGWTGDHCETNIDDCSPNPCQNDGICTDGVASHTCSCPQGWEGGNCEIDVNECTKGTDDCDPRNGVCTNKDGGFTCSCLAPAVLESDGRTCTATCSLACDPLAHCIADGTKTACVCDAPYEDVSPNSDGTICDGPPVATTTSASGFEDTPIPITLQGSDKGGDALVFVVDALSQIGSAVEACQGKLYQYSQAFMDDPDPVNGVEINTFPTAVTDVQGRVIYMPAADCNTPGVPEEVQVSASLVYHARELGYPDDDPDHNSPPQAVPIYVEEVNDPPTPFPSGDYPLSCVESCTYEEDFGNPRGVEYNPAVVLAGGFDTEGAKLTVEIVGLTCRPGSTLTSLDGNPVAIGTSVTDFVSGELAEAFKFKPAPDDFVVGAPYCTIEYKLSDGELDSEDTFTVSIYVSPVNDLPRLAESQVVAYEGTPKDFTLTASDIDTGSFKGYIMECSEDESAVGQLAYRDTTGTLIPIDCEAVNGGTPFALPPDSSTAVWSFQYTPPPGGISGLSLFQLAIALDDEQGTPITNADWYYVPVDVLAINQAPTITVASPSLTISPGASCALGIDLDDAESGFNPVQLTMSLNIGRFTGTVPSELEAQLRSFTISERSVEAVGPLSALKWLVQTLQFTSSEQGSGALTVTLNDQGYTGGCFSEPEGFFMHFCLLEAAATITIHVTKPPAP